MEWLVDYGVTGVMVGGVRSHGSKGFDYMGRPILLIPLPTRVHPSNVFTELR